MKLLTYKLTRINSTVMFGIAYQHPSQIANEGSQELRFQAPNDFIVASNCNPSLNEYTVYLQGMWQNQNLNVVSRIFDTPQEAANYEFKVETALTAWARAGGFNVPRDVEVVAREDGTITLYSPEGEPERKGVSLEKGSSIFRDTMTIPTGSK